METTKTTYGIKNNGDNTYWTGQDFNVDPDTVKNFDTYENVLKAQYNLPMEYSLAIFEIVSSVGFKDGGVLPKTDQITNGDLFDKYMMSGDAYRDSHSFEDYLNENQRATTKRKSGGSTHYYTIPKGTTELHQIIRHKKMPHGIGEAFCALYRLNDNGEYIRNLEKVLFYVGLELENAKKEL